jgi:hypothetical protein
MVGDMLFFFAMEDLTEGVELTTTYIHCQKLSYSKRAERLAHSWGFTCDCRLCELDRRGGPELDKELALLVAKYDNEIM